MQRTYRQRNYYCGEYLEVELFPVYTKARGRGKRKKPTSDTQQRLNQRHAEGKLRRRPGRSLAQYGQLWPVIAAAPDGGSVSISSSADCSDNGNYLESTTDTGNGTTVKHLYTYDSGTSTKYCNVYICVC